MKTSAPRWSDHTKLYRHCEPGGVEEVGSSRKYARHKKEEVAMYTGFPRVLRRDLEKPDIHPSYN